MKRVWLVPFGFIAIALACGPGFNVAVFSYQRHPDLPRSAFINGQLGVLRPTYARSYLVLAYRYFSGVGLSAREREQARDYYKDRDTQWWDRTGVEWDDRWNTLRSRVPGAARTISPLTQGQFDYRPESHSFAMNCAEDAFRIAHHTLEARIAGFGVRSVAVREWTRAQDTVFANCDGPTGEIPDPAPASLPAVIRADRAYQIAAAHFYSRGYQKARDEFAAIAREPSSPWRLISRYLVVRTLLRMNETVAVQREADRILADPSLAAIHGMTANLLHREDIRHNDESYFRDLARQLRSRGQDNGLREELWNYTTLYDRFIGDGDPNAIFPPDKPVKPDPALFEQDDLSSWVFHFQSRDPASAVRSRAMWQRTRSLPWLVAALAHANAVDAERYGLLDAARALPATVPARPTVTYHYYRLLLEAGKRDDVREGVDALLTAGGLPPSSVNLFRGLRMMAAPRFDDFLDFAVRRPVLVTWNHDVGQTPVREAPRSNRAEPVRFDRDSTRVLNRLTPFRLLRDAAITGDVPTHLRREFALATFTRGVMLDEDATVVASRLRELAPELASYAEAYERQISAEDRRFAGVFLLLHQPEARPYLASGIDRQTRPGKIDNYRDNWWCPMDLPIEFDSQPNIQKLEGQSQRPAFLTDDDAAQADKELDLLVRLGNGTEYMGGVVLDYARTHPADPRIAEALHYVVRTGRYGCADTNTWKVTRDGFRLLHTVYPRSPWAARTATWRKETYTFRDRIKEMR